MHFAGLRFRMGVLTAVLAGVAVATTGCGGSTQASSGTPSTVKIGVFGPDVTFSPLYAAAQPDGAIGAALAKDKAKVKLVTITSGAELIAALAGGSVDMAVIPGSAGMAAAAKGAPVVPVMNMFDGPAQAIVAAKKNEASKGKDVAGFDGSTWGYQRVGSVSQLESQLTAEKAGLDWSKQKQVPLGNGNVTAAAFGAGRADIASTTPGDAAAVITGGSGYLVTNPQDDEGDPIANQLASVLAASSSFVKKYPTVTQQVVTAMVSTLHTFASSDSSAALAATPPDFQQAIGDKWDAEWDLTSSGFKRATGGFSSDELADTIEGAQTLQLLPADYQVKAGLFSNTYVKKAYADLKLSAPAGLS